MVHRALHRLFGALSSTCGVLVLLTASVLAEPATREPRPPVFGAQYDTTHVYVGPAELGPLVSSFVATFGGTTSSQTVLTVTPAPSEATLQAARTPAGLISAFAFTTGIPYPFGAERTGYLVSDLDTAVSEAKSNGAAVLVAPFNDPIGRDAIIEWPGGIVMQLYRHTSQTQSPPLALVPEDRVYVSPDAADAFVRDFAGFARGKLVSDTAKAPGIEVGEANTSYRRIRIESNFGKMTVFVTDGHLPYPYGREKTGYQVTNLGATLRKAKLSGATVLVPPFSTDGRESAVVAFPGGYVAEVHAMLPQNVHVSGAFSRAR